MTQSAPHRIGQSVVAVPPLARHENGDLDVQANDAIVNFIAAGEVTDFLYGGNAVVYHMTTPQFDQMVAFLSERESPQHVFTPSIGPMFGTAMDQADRLRDTPFQTVMLLPTRDVIDHDGIATGVRRLSDRLGKPLVLYLKHDRWLSARHVAQLDADGCVSWIKYAVVRDDPANDRYLDEVMEHFPADRMISGIGEQPAPVHVAHHGMAGFTSGCVCVDPQSSTSMRAALRAGDHQTAESIRRHFEPLEDLRNEISPIRVLHAAVEIAGIAATGPMPPMLSPIDASDRSRIAAAIESMRQSE